MLHEASPAENCPKFPAGNTYAHKISLRNTAKLHGPMSPIFFHPHVADTSQSPERWRYHVARPPKENASSTIKVFTFHKSRTDLTPINLASLPLEALCPRLCHFTKRLAALPSLLVSHSFQVFIFIKEDSLQG